MPREEAVLSNESLDAFVQRMNDRGTQPPLTSAELFTTNTRPVPASKLLAKQAWAGLSDAGIVNVPDRVPHAGGQVALQPSDPDFAFVNEDWEWLTYETVLNQKRFRRSNQEHELALYTLPFRQTEVWMVKGIDREVLASLQQAFFPELSADKLEDAIRKHWPWRNEKFETLRLVTLGPVTSRQKGRPREIDEAVRKAVAATRAEIALYRDARVVLPYNYYDNNASSFALGTREAAEAKQLRPEHTWAFYKTASRSNVVELKAVKQSKSAWKALERKWAEWPFDKGDVARKDVADTTKYPGIAAGTKRLKLSALGASHVSLKTGVCYVGSADQSIKSIGEAGKDCLDSNWIVACLRSDLVAEIAAELKGQGFAAQSATDELTVLTELLSIVEKEPRTERFESKSYTRRDGVQVRDVSLLRKTHVYVFPGSIPFIKPDAKTLAGELGHVEDDAWCDFWREHWAAGLGRAKALFLLRYGLQHLNPNPQNYLIELSKGVDRPAGPSRIVIRDLQDASLSREVLWALYGDASAAVPEGADQGGALTAAFRARAEATEPASHEHRVARLLQWELQNVEDYQETGRVPESFGPAGTQLLWWRFSAFTNSKKDGEGELAGRLGKGRADRAFQVLARWGLAHAASYLTTLERALGAEVRSDVWKRLPSTALKDEEDLSAALHAYLRSADGQQKLRDYRTRKWAPVAPAKTLVIRSTSGPLAYTPVQLTQDAGAWWRATDAEGKLALYTDTGAAPSRVAIDGTEHALTARGGDVYEA